MTVIVYSQRQLTCFKDYARAKKHGGYAYAGWSYIFNLISIIPKNETVIHERLKRYLLKFTKRSGDERLFISASRGFLEWLENVANNWCLESTEIGRTTLRGTKEAVRLALASRDN